MSYFLSRLFVFGHKVNTQRERGKSNRKCNKFHYIQSKCVNTVVKLNAPNFSRLFITKSLCLLAFVRACVFVRADSRVWWSDGEVNIKCNFMQKAKMPKLQWLSRFFIANQMIAQLHTTGRHGWNDHVTTFLFLLFECGSQILNSKQMNGLLMYLEQTGKKLYCMCVWPSTS